MKKNFIRIIILIAVIWLIFFIKDIPKYRFGYFVEGPELKYEHRDADVLKLENGNVLVLGANQYEWPNEKDLKNMKHKSSIGIEDMIIKETPSELYITNKNKFVDFKMPNNILYRPKGILLKNNKILLTFVHDPNDKNIKYTEYVKIKRTAQFPYDSMAIVNLDTLKVERIIKRKLNNNALNLILNKAQDNNQDTSDILFANNNDIESEISWYKKITLDNNKVIFINDNTTSKERKYNLYKYLYSTNSISLVGTINCKPTDIKQINNQEILIICSNFKYIRATDNKLVPSKDYPIKTCNINTNEIKTTSNMPKYRCDFNSMLINNRYFLITGGHDCSYPFRRYYRNSLILDLDKNKIYNAAKLPYNVDKPNMVMLDNGNVLILDNKLNIYAKKILIFKNNTK